MFNMIKRDERGFSLIELAVVVAIIGILAAIAIPTFLVQRKGAQDRQVHSALRNMMSIAKAAAANTDDGAYPVDVTDFDEPSFEIRESPDEDDNLQPSTGPSEISVNLLDERTLVMAAKSASGACWFVVTPLNAATVYAVDHETDNDDCDASLVTAVDNSGTVEYLIDTDVIQGDGFGKATELEAEVPTP